MIGVFFNDQVKCQILIILQPEVHFDRINANIFNNFITNKHILHEMPDCR